MKYNNAHLAYCTNIHPAETWQETWQVLKSHTLTVRNKLREQGVDFPAPGYAIGLRLSAIAAEQLLRDNQLESFKKWLNEEQCYVFTINGFPYGSFHGTRVKEKVYQPDWSTEERLAYTNNLFTIIAELAPDGVDGSVSTLPGSFKEFAADESLIFKNLEACAQHIETLSIKHNKDLHLGLEPEPLGHFENTEETLAFFDRFLATVSNPDLIKRRIGINYDTCHFALEFDDCQTSLDAFRNAGLRISKVHLSSALEFDPDEASAIKNISRFDEPTYLHQVIVQDEAGNLTRFKDLPDYIQHSKLNIQHSHKRSARIHFHIPLYSNPDAPLGSTQFHAADAINYAKQHPDFCTHFEIETYTWRVLPDELQIPIEDQIVKEYSWVLNQ